MVFFRFSWENVGTNDSFLSFKAYQELWRKQIITLVCLLFSILWNFEENITTTIIQTNTQKWKASGDDAGRKTIRYTAIGKKIIFETSIPFSSNMNDLSSMLTQSSRNIVVHRSSKVGPIKYNVYSFHILFQVFFQFVFASGLKNIQYKWDFIGTRQCDYNFSRIPIFNLMKFLGKHCNYNNSN